MGRLTEKNETCPVHTTIHLVPKKIIAAFASWRTGKTDYISIEHLIKRQLYRNPDVLHLIAANTYSQLVGSTLRTAFEKLDWLGIPHEPRQLPRTGRPFSLFIFNGTKWVEFLCRSMDNFDTVAGTTLGSFWLDEVWNTEKWTFDLALSRLSDKNSKLLQGVLSSTTDEPSHWMYTEIVQKLEFNKAVGKGNKPRDFMEIVYGTTYDNVKNLAPGYIEGLETSLDPKLFARNVLSKWVSLVQGKMFYQFDRKLNIRDLKYESNLPLLVSSDFNVDPMCWSIWQRHKEELWCIDQIMVSGNADTETCCRELASRYFQNPQNLKRVFWFGDASGRSGSTKSQNSDYDIIKMFCRANRLQLEFNVDLANPSIRDSANAVNARLKNGKGQANIFFDEQKCPDVILSVEGCSYKPGTTEKDESKDRDPKSRVKTHFGDTVRYIVNQLFPLRHQSTWSQ
jgi:hypothetical protein